MPQSIDINRIVESVLDQIAQEAREKNIVAATNTPTSRPTVNNAGAKRQMESAAANNTGDELFLSDRVISLALIERELAGRKRLAITPGAILTPSVRDYLKERGISISTAIPQGPDPSTPNTTANTLPVPLIAALTSYNPAPLANRLAQKHFHVTPESSDCLIETTDRLAQLLADPDRLAVILTTHHAAALCLANRHKTLRAIHVDNENQLEPIVSAVGANVLIVSPRARSAYQLEQTITRFLRMPPEKHTCPDPLKSRLA